LAIVIVNWNVRALLAACLASLAADPACPSWDVIVVDNASADGSADMVRSAFPWVRLIESPVNLGFADGCQAGWEASDSAFVLLLNPDTEVPVGALGTMVSDLEARPSAAILGSRLVAADGRLQRSAGGAFPTLRNIAWNYLFLDRLLPRRWAPAAVFIECDPDDVREMDWVSGAAMLLRRAAVGPRIFDPEYFMFGEDMALCDRMRREGWDVFYSGRQTVLHHHGQSYQKQSSIEVLVTIYRGPRTFFRATHGAAAAVAYDALLLVGYVLRWGIAGVLNLLRPGRGYDDMARFSRSFVGIILRSAVSRAPP
jgi:GT2 family glycosyltransferase